MTADSPADSRQTQILSVLGNEILSKPWFPHFLANSFALANTQTRPVARHLQSDAHIPDHEESRKVPTPKFWCADGIRPTICLPILCCKRTCFPSLVEINASYLSLCRYVFFLS